MNTILSIHPNLMLFSQFFEQTYIACIIHVKIKEKSKKVKVRQLEPIYFHNLFCKDDFI